MPKIHILNDSVINRIAAGEVIERPASVVKELIENALDSGADEIRIDIENAGKKKIKVADNGSGMSEEDALLSFKRHATSKILSGDDLFKISSLGFRGEALASIAEISNLKIITKTKEAENGTFLEIESGKLLKKENIGSPDGTSITVSDLFFNVPVRKKYLKSDEIELNHIIRAVTSYALLNKDISIRLSHNSRELINSPKTGSMLDNISYIYGPDIGKNLLEVSYRNDNIAVEGYISKPQLTRADSSGQSLYINKRCIKNNIVSDAVYEAYHTLLFINRHPVFILNITLDPEEIDVNVHPAKSIIRLKNESLIRKEIFAAIRDAFKDNDLIFDASLESESLHVPVKKYPFSKDRQSVLALKEEQAEYQKQEKKELQPGNGILGPFCVLGQVNKTYIIAENPKGLAIIDQHAVQERVNYERFMEEFLDRSVKTQSLVVPKLIELAPLQYQAAMLYKDFIKKMGFNFEGFGSNSIKLASLPEVFGILKSALLIDILNELSSSRSGILERDIEGKIIRMACRASVKAGKELTKPEMEQLLDDLEKTKIPYSCPHGRPTIINLSIADLEKKFKRVGY
ncbi:DNA mismatch repair endonuclease MutL [Candidatus Woesearchaeota archaeon]|nr:DNA mismatch repair endonuclease MutL [Candidatus Woesearchaeota archaeon]